MTNQHLHYSLSANGEWIVDEHCVTAAGRGSTGDTYRHCQLQWKLMRLNKEWLRYEKRVDICITESFAVHLKRAQHCKSTIPQYKIKKEITVQYH